MLFDKTFMSFSKEIHIFSLKLSVFETILSKLINIIVVTSLSFFSNCHETVKLLLISLLIIYSSYDHLFILLKIPLKKSSYWG